MSFVLWAPVFVLLPFFGCLSVSQVPMHNLLSFAHALLSTSLFISFCSMCRGLSIDKKSWRSCNPFACSYPSSSLFLRIFIFIAFAMFLFIFWMVFSKTELFLCSYCYVIAHKFTIEWNGTHYERRSMFRQLCKRKYRKTVPTNSSECTFILPKELKKKKKQYFRLRNIQQTTYKRLYSWYRMNPVKSICRLVFVYEMSWFERHKIFGFRIDLQ